MFEAQEGVKAAHQGGGGRDIGQDASASQGPAKSEVRACFAPGLSVSAMEKTQICADT